MTTETSSPGSPPGNSFRRMPSQTSCWTRPQTPRSWCSTWPWTASLPKETRSTLWGHTLTASMLTTRTLMALWPTPLIALTWSWAMAKPRTRLQRPHFQMPLSPWTALKGTEPTKQGRRHFFNYSKSYLLLFLTRNSPVLNVDPVAWFLFALEARR